MKGFLTLATGKDLYYILAHNLLLSYRLHARSSTPFAILCDRENEWTADFDQAVVIDHPTHSFMDKMRMMDLSPFDETIFIEADSLIYKDLDGMWDIFKDSPDIGLLGRTYPKDSELGWWKDENLGALKDKVDYKVICQGGVYYVRNNGKDLPAIQETCRFIEENYMSYHFAIFGDRLEDETILCLAAAVHHIRPVANWFDAFVYYPEAVFSRVDIRKGLLRYTLANGSGKPNSKAFLIHFVTHNTLSPHCNGLYYREVSRMKYQPDRRRERRNAWIVMGRRAVNHSRLIRAIANLFPKEWRNKCNRVDLTQ
jgi:hypothetical protein